MENLYFFNKLLILAFTYRRFPIQPFVVGRPGYPRNFTKHEKVESLILMQFLNGDIFIPKANLVYLRLLSIASNFFRNAFSARKRSFSLSSLFISNFIF